MTLPAEKSFIALRAAEKKIFRKRKHLPGPQWMEKNVYVPIGSRQGLYRHKNNPALYGVLDWSTRHHVRVVVLAKGIQIGGTLGFYGLLLREGEYSSDSAIVVTADEKTLKKLFKKRLQVMIDKSEALASLKSSNPDDMTQYSITLSHGFTIDGAWASSEMSVSSESYRVVILDEISKYKSRGNIEDAKARTTVYPDTHKIWILSSPGIDSDDENARDPLMVEAEACDVMLEFRAKCPDCGQPQVMRFEQFKWPGQSNLEGKIETDPKAIRRNKSAWYECEYCQSRWNDYKRDKAIQAAMEDGWQPTDDDNDIEFPQSVYIHFPSWLSPYVSMSSVVADWLEAQGDEEKLRKWYNRHAGVSYRYGKKSLPQATINALKDDRPEGLIPSTPIAAITCVADMQKRGFWYKITAWGYGLEQESWTLKSGFIDSWEGLRRIMFESQFEDVNKGKYIVTLRGMDSGGGEGENEELSRTAEAYLFAAANSGVVLFKGRQKMARHYNVTEIDRIPGTNKALPNSAQLYTVNATFFKDKLANKLKISPADPGAWHLHKDTDEDFAKQMTAEYRNQQGLWICPKHKANHLWDCSYMELALVDIAQVKFWPKPEDVVQKSGARILSNGI